jgi:plasmid maintenance system killer protein
LHLNGEKIKWHFKDFYSIRINNQWRIIFFYLEDGNATGRNNKLSLKQLK